MPRHLISDENERMKEIPTRRNKQVFQKKGPGLIGEDQGCILS